MSGTRREDARSIADLAHEFANAYYLNDREWERWLADLRVAMRRLDNQEEARG